MRAIPANLACPRRSILGLDIGGANLKAAHTNKCARSEPFALWKNRDGLSTAVSNLLAAMPPHHAIAMTMTGELCDCYASKREGVLHILASVQSAARATPVHVWSLRETFLSIADARQDPLTVAAANWLALACWAGRLVPAGPAVLIDMGTTTTDIIPLLDGRPAPLGRTDAARLQSGELVYAGWRRTSIAALLGVGDGLMAEYFATTLDAFLLRGLAREDPADVDTADSRPATRICAHARLARMLGGDGESINEAMTQTLARRVCTRVRSLIAKAIERVIARSFPPDCGPPAFLLSGSGESILRKLLDRRRLTFPGRTSREADPPPAPLCVSLSEQFGHAVSEAACAYAVASLADDSSPSNSSVAGAPGSTPANRMARQ